MEHELAGCGSREIRSGSIERKSERGIGSIRTSYESAKRISLSFEPFSPRHAGSFYSLITVLRGQRPDIYIYILSAGALHFCLRIAKRGTNVSSDSLSSRFVAPPTFLVSGAPLEFLLLLLLLLPVHILFSGNCRRNEPRHRGCRAKGHASRSDANARPMWDAGASRYHRRDQSHSISLIIDYCRA